MDAAGARRARGLAPCEAVTSPVPPRPKVTVRPMHLTLWDEASITNVRRPIGYRWECSCGKYGRIRRKRAEAIGEMLEHRRVHE